MGLCYSQNVARVNVDGASFASDSESLVMDHLNIHNIHSDMKVHTVVTNEMDYDHQSALYIPLGEVSDEQLVAEMSERQLWKIDNPPVYDYESHVRSMKIPLEAATDDELICEVVRRKLIIHDFIDEKTVAAIYDLGKNLGHGASGKVYKCRHRETGMYYACKVIERDTKMNDAQSMSTEVEIMKRIRHENVVAMYEIFQTPQCVWLILELVDGGNLREYLTQVRSNYNELQAAKHIKQIILGVHHLHSMGVVHRDLKLENILLKKNGENMQIKIADFGLSALCRIGENGYHGSKSSKRKEFQGLSEPWGTAEYEAPELLEGAYGPQADMWAVGCMLYEMLSGHKAFQRKADERTLEKLYSRIKRGEVDFKRSSWWTISAQAKDFISRLLEIDPAKRLSATEALRHKWLRTIIVDN